MRRKLRQKIISSYCCRSNPISVENVSRTLLFMKQFHERIQNICKYYDHLLYASFATQRLKRKPACLKSTKCAIVKLCWSFFDFHQQLAEAFRYLVTFQETYYNFYNKKKSIFSGSFYFGLVTSIFVLFTTFVKSFSLTFVLRWV